MQAFVSRILHFRLIVLAVAAGLLTLGVVGVRSAPVDVLPEFTPPYAEVQTEALGLSAEEVEQLITVPLEADLLNGVQGISTIRSESVPGLSSVVMVFEDGTDIYRARQLVEERLTQAHALPNVSRPPMLLQPLSTSNRVLMIGMSSDDVSLLEQSVIARWTLRPRLMGIPGVANVAVWGMRDQQLQVQVDARKMERHDVTLAQVIRSAGNAQVVSPLTFLEASTPGTGGFIETPQQRLQVRHLLEKLTDPAELAKVPIDGTNGELRLSDVATIVVDHQPLIGDAVVSGGDGLVLVVEKFPNADTTSVTEEVEETLEALSPGLAGISFDIDAFRPASYLEDSMDNLGLALAVGAGFALLVLIVLRRNWMSVAVAAVGVATSLATALVVLTLLGQGFNALVVLGLAGALAVVVDASVGSTERLVGGLAQVVQGPRRNARGAFADAWARTRSPAIYGSVVALLAFAPLAVVGGDPGKLLSPMVLAFTAAVVAATVVAATVTPALASVLFTRVRAGGAEPRVRHRLRDWYSSTLAATTVRSRGATVAATVLAIVGLGAVPLLSLSLVPQFEDRAVLVSLEAEPGTANPAMTAIAADAAARIQALPGVEDVGAHVGRAITGDRVTNVNSADIWVGLESGADHDATMAAIAAEASETEGAAAAVMTYAERKLRDVGALRLGKEPVHTTGLDALVGASETPLTVRLYGEDLDVLSENSERIRAMLAGISGVENPRVDDVPSVQPSVEIEVDLDRARDAGLTPGDIRRAEATLLHGIQVGSVFEDQMVFDVVVQGDPEIRTSVENVADIPVDLPDGGRVRLGDVADVRVVETPTVIKRDAVSRWIDIVADVSGRSVASVASDAEEALAALDLPLAYHAEVVTRETTDVIGLSQIIGFVIAAMVASYLLFQAALNSWRLAGLVAALLPLALTGGLVATLVAGGELGLGSLVGLLAILGLAARHGVVLISHLQRLEPRDGESPKERAVRGAGECVVPATVSLLALAALLLPPVVMGGRAGLELVHPMAITIVGGLVTTLVTMSWLLPAIYAHAETRRSGRTTQAPTGQDPLAATREPVGPTAATRTAR